MPDTPVLSYAAPPDHQRQHRAIGAILWTILGIVFLVLILQINRRISSGHSGDFRHFYFAAGALLDHRDLYGPVPLDVVERALGRPAGPVQKQWYTTDSERYLYPPLIALLYTPIAHLQFETAQRVMLIINALLIFVGVLLTTRAFSDRFELRRNGWLLAATALLGTLLNLDKVHVELQMFQTNSLMFCLFALSLYWLDRRPSLAGIPLAVILNIKYLSLAMVPWLLIRRRWGTAASCILSTVAFALLPAVVSGWDPNLKNLSVAYGGLLHMVGIHAGAEQANVDDIRDYLSCSITSAMARTTLPGQSLTLPMIGVACIAGVAVCIVIWMYLQKRVPVFEWPPAEHQVKQPYKSVIGVEFVAIVAATLCFSPQTNTRHLMLALLLTIPLASLILRPREKGDTGEKGAGEKGAGEKGDIHLFLTRKRWMSPFFAPPFFAPPFFARMPAIVGALLIGVGFIFPPGGQAPQSHHLALKWFGIGGQCWCLLLAMFALVWSTRSAPDGA